MGKRRKSKQSNPPSPPSKTKQNQSKFSDRLATIILAKGLVTSPEESICLAEAIVAEIEEELIRRAIAYYDGKMSFVARQLGIGRSTLYRKLKEYQIDPDRPLEFAD